MNRFTLILLFLVTWLSVFAQTQFSGLRLWLNVPMALSPALICYAALTHGWTIELATRILLTQVGRHEKSILNDTVVKIQNQQ